MNARESVRGVGRDHPGATDVTMRIWYALQQAGDDGLSLEEILEQVGPNISPGYAWRRYVRLTLTNRKRMQVVRSENGSIASHNKEVTDTPGRRAAALRSLVRGTLQDMLRYDRPSALRRPNGRYVVGPRKPKSVFTDEVHDFDGSVSRRAVADMELARVVGPILKHIDDVRGRRGNLPTISVKLELALRQWYRAQPASHSQPT